MSGRNKPTRRDRRPAAARGTLALLLTVVLALTLLLVWAGPAAAEGETTTSEPAATQATTEAPPELDYTFTWPTFILTFGLVIGYYIFIFKMSEKEFKGVIVERFGPKR